jgi:hypothetical protein
MALFVQFTPSIVPRWAVLSLLNAPQFNKI